MIAMGTTPFIGLRVKPRRSLFWACLPPRGLPVLFGSKVSAAKHKGPHDRLVRMKVVEVQR